MKVAPYGRWNSPVVPSMAVASTVRLGEIEVDGDDLYWTEERPHEGGRVAILRRRPDGSTREVLPRPYSARSRVHEYGGGSFLPWRGSVVFAEEHDQRLYRIRPGRSPEPLTPAGADLRYADLSADPRRDRLLCVLERHRPGAEPANAVAAVRAGRCAEPEILLEGEDFYAAPRVSSDGRRLCWQQWSHPDMPWDSSEVWTADLGDDGRAHTPRRVAGGPGESVMQPRWAADGSLLLVSDRSGWWGLHRLRDGEATALTPPGVEFARPQWVFHLCSYWPLDDGSFALAGARDGVWGLYVRDGGRLREVPTGFTDLGSVVREWDSRIVVDAASPTRPRSIVAVDPRTGVVEVLAEVQAEERVTQRWLSIPEPVVFSAADGSDAHGFFYPPHNPEYRAPDGELPPLIVRAHGGPTAATTTMLDFGVQFWTSRGYGLLDVNYGGSSGYGRAYRERLRERWGVVDVDDCCAGADALAQRGVVDGRRLLIEGESAGGYTVLAALAFRDTFAAGASYYGIADLEAFSRGTHKFESRYCDYLVGPLDAVPERYAERSPLLAADALSTPVIFFQGLRDPVVLAEQSERMYRTMRDRGVSCEYVPFAEEEHGFRNGASIEASLEAQKTFYERALAIA